MYPDWTPAPDPLVAHRLPEGDDAPDGCELNERVNELPPGRATHETVRYLINAGLAAAAVGIGPRYACGSEWSDGSFFWAAMLAGLSGLTAAHFLAGSRLAHYWAVVTLAWVLLGAVLRVQARLPDARLGHPLTFPLAVAACGALAHLVSTQFVYYQAADLAHEWNVSAAWRADWGAFESGRPPARRPDLGGIPWATVALVPAAVLSWVGVAGWGVTGAAGYLVGLLLLAPAVWPRGTDPVACLAAGWHAVRVFLTYERRACLAPGAFRFPTRWLRPHARRFVAVLAVLTLVAVSTGTRLPASWPRPVVYPVAEQPAVAPEVVARPPMSRAEENHLDGLAGDYAARQHYLAVLRSRRAAADEKFRRAGESYARSTLVTVAACVLLPPAVAFGTLVFLFGPALAAGQRLSDRSS